MTVNPLNQQEWLNAAKEKNPSMTDEQLTTIWNQKYLPLNKDKWINSAKQKNPGMNEDQLAGIWDKKYKPQADQFMSNAAKDMESGNNPAKDASSLQAFNIGAGRGFYDIGQGAKQRGLQLGEKVGLAERGSSENYRKKVNDELKYYDKLSEEHPFSAGAGRVTGNIAASLPALALRVPGLAGLPGAVASGGVQGGVLGALEYDQKGDNIGVNSGIGTALGSAMPIVGNVAGKALGKLFKGADNTLSETAAKEASGRLQEAKDIGVDGLSFGSITRDPIIQGQEESMLKGKIGEATKAFRQAHKDINEQIYQAKEKMLDKLGFNRKSLEEAGEESQDILRGTYSTRQEQIIGMYDAAKEAPGGNIALPKDGINEAYTFILDNFTEPKFSKKVSEILSDINSGPNLPKGYSPENIAASPRLAQALAKEGSQFDVAKANDLIKALNHSYAGAKDHPQKLAISMLKKRVFDALDTVADSDSPAKQLFAEAREARKKLGDVFNQDDIVEGILRRKAEFTDFVAPEDIAKKIFSGNSKITNLNKIEAALKESGEKGIEVWNDLRGAKLSDMFDKATNDIGGVRQLSFAKLVKQSKQVGDPILKKLWGNEELYGDHKKLVNVLDYWQNKAEGMTNPSGSANMISRAFSTFAGSLAKVSTLGLSEKLRPIAAILLNAYKDSKDKTWVMKNLAAGRGEFKVKKDQGFIQKGINRLPNSQVATNAVTTGYLQPEAPSSYSNED